jgi:hypothetical protein
MEFFIMKIGDGYFRVAFDFFKRWKAYLWSGSNEVIIIYVSYQLITID